MSKREFRPTSPRRPMLKSEDSSSGKLLFTHDLELLPQETSFGPIYTCFLPRAHNKENDYKDKENKATHVNRANNSYINSPLQNNSSISNANNNGNNTRNTNTGHTNATPVDLHAAFQPILQELEKMNAHSEVDRRETQRLYEELQRAVASSNEDRDRTARHLEQLVKSIADIQGDREATKRELEHNRIEHNEFRQDIDNLYRYLKLTTPSRNERRLQRIPSGGAVEIVPSSQTEEDEIDDNISEFESRDRDI
ncbi:hypothetical protein BX616_004996 [Lobosporangium transversale]|uniref:Uncharacterized protein n=1 Tax=Lobosporangium transversale TaxID=64571 RepID=A0A1Y2H5B3_9FUNG|nr:hypothetical protein BCR41DRAFT_69449 [Lobosporangium transversale]KAF9897778.1 hypothetical protein BX616_004996 [Lobosporangium transversale]ORZ28232.1 hypothetical protein BCR41DRAFT_69449 [Lobosporangium transversale]|eukprot:XP_021885917.1 hypothetical protein BCR41DRAFT_69449 [Lobosporangium transversale]